MPECKLPTSGDNVQIRHFVRRSVRKEMQLRMIKGAKMAVSTSDVTKEDIARELGSDVLRELEATKGKEYEDKLVSLKEQVAGKRSNVGEISLENLLEANDILIVGMVEKVNGKEVNVEQWMNDLPEEDFDFLTQEINRVASAASKKK